MARCGWLPLTVLLLVSLRKHHQTEGANILVLHPLLGLSHVVQMKVLGEALLARGHQVTVVRFRNVRDVSFHGSNLTVHTLSVDNTHGKWPYLTREREAKFFMPLELLWSSGLSVGNLPVDAFKTNQVLCNVLLGNVNLLGELQKIQWHVAIVDLATNECGLALAHRLRAPVVGYWALPPVGGEMDVSPASLPASYVPSFMSRLPARMSFLQRLHNSVYKMASYIIMAVQFHVTHQEIQKHLPGAPHPSQLLADISGLLINSDHCLDYPRLLPPTFVNVGGLQCTSRNPLPKDMEEFIEGSGEAGVVIFTMGATFDAKVVPRHLLDALMNAFGRLPQRVLVKFDEEYQPLPKNVKLYKWLPQQDLLAHPKTRLFFTHCGLHGVMEAICHGIPMVGMPVYGDQVDVMQRLLEKGVAVGLEKDAESQDIYDAMMQVLTNDSYRQNARRLSSLFWDQPQSALDRAIWLVEYVSRHRGADHLRLASRHLHWTQVLCLDVILVFILIGLLLVYLISKVVVRAMKKFASAIRRITKLLGSYAGDKWQKKQR